MLRSLRSRLTLLFIALAIIPTALVSFILTQNSFGVLRDEALQTQKQVAVRSRVEIESFVNTREQQLRDLQEITNFASLDIDAQNSLLRNLQANERSYQDFILLDGEGQEILHVARQELITEDHLQDLSETPEFMAIAGGAPVYYSPVYLDERSREPLIALALPYYNLQTGQIRNVLIAELRFRSIWDKVGEIGQSLEDEQIQVYIVNDAGNVVAHANPSVVLSGTTFNVQDSNEQVAGLDGNSVFLATEEITLGDQTLTVVAEQPASVALAAAQDGLNIAVVVTVLAFLVAIVMGFLMVRQVIRPVERLSVTAQEISQGNLQARAEVQGQTEISTLARAFNQMTNQLSDSINNLEQRVRQRTAALEAAREEAEGANRVKSQFLANMSHELRTPLNAVLNFTAFVKDEVFGPVNGEQEEALDEALGSGRHLLSLINDILDLTKIEAGMMDLFIEEVDFNVLLGSTASVAKGLVKDKPLTFTADIQPDLPTSYGDRRRLRQVFLNIVSNAIKYTPSGEVTLSASFEDDAIQIQVSDTGIGIADEDKDLVFESFKQSKHDLTRSLGTGLGLPISKFFVESHRGKLWFESEVDVGTTFYITLPVLTEQEAYAANNQAYVPAKTSSELTGAAAS